jgi:hypothetical protein
MYAEQISSQQKEIIYHFLMIQVMIIKQNYEVTDTRASIVHATLRYILLWS